MRKTQNCKVRNNQNIFDKARRFAIKKLGGFETPFGNYGDLTNEKLKSVNITAVKHTALITTGNNAQIVDEECIKERLCFKIAEALKESDCVQYYTRENSTGTYTNWFAEITVIKPNESENDSVDILKSKQGYWKDEGDPLSWTCSNCGYVVFRYNNTKYCPRCGAYMKGD